MHISRTLFIINTLWHCHPVTTCLTPTSLLYCKVLVSLFTQNAVKNWDVGVQGAAELDTPKVLAAGSQLSLWFKAHMPDILTAVPQGHSLKLLVLPCLCASDSAWHLASLPLWLIGVINGFATQMSCVCVWIPKVLTAHLKPVQASALLAPFWLRGRRQPCLQ